MAEKWPVTTTTDVAKAVRKLRPAERLEIKQALRELETRDRSVRDAVDTRTAVINGWRIWWLLMGKESLIIVWKVEEER